MDIDIEKLRLITNQIFDHISCDLKISKVPLEQDYYWNIPSDSLFDVDSTPSELDIGQLFDDLEFLLKTLDNEEQAVSLMFVHLAPLLRYVGEKVGQ